MPIKSDLWKDLEVRLVIVDKTTRKALARHPTILALYHALNDPDGPDDYDECFEAAVGLAGEFQSSQRRPYRDRHAPTPPDDHSAPPNVCGVLGGILYRAAEIAEVELLAAARRGLSTAWADPLRHGDPAWWDEYEKGHRELVAKYGVQHEEMRRVIVKLLQMEQDPVQNPVQIAAAKSIRRKLVSQVSFPDSSQFERNEFFLALDFPHNGPLAFRDFWDELPEREERPSFPDEFQPGGFLFWLHAAARVLAERYCWDVVGALGFLLVNPYAPTMHVVKVQYRVRAAHPAASRIVLTLDPHLSPDQVREIYADAQGKFVGPQKAQSDLSLALVGFVYTQTWWSLDDKRSWQILMNQWNQEQEFQVSVGKPCYQHFTELRRFKEAVNRAKERLVGVDIRGADGFSYYPSTRQVNAERRTRAAKRRESGKGKMAEIKDSGAVANGAETDPAKSLNPPT